MTYQASGQADAAGFIAGYDDEGRYVAGYDAQGKLAFRR